MNVSLQPVTVACPCGTEISVPVEVEIIWDDDEDGTSRQRLNFDPDYSDLWAHAWTHDETVNFEFDAPDGDS